MYEIPYCLMQTQKEIEMGRAERTIPSTHTGSLPRPDDLIQIMWAVGDGIPVDANALDQRVCSVH
jgi:5-methyltetrahydropteroyltriglutamate--homocysteine methyltransferase